MKRETYDPEHPCPKCRSTTVTTSWCKGNQWRLGSTWCSFGEHFHRYCQRCHYEWEEDVLPDLSEEPEHGPFDEPALDAEAPRKDVMVMESDEVNILWRDQHVNILKATEVKGRVRLTIEKLDAQTQ